MWSLVKLSFLLSTVFHSIAAEFQNPYHPVAALFGPKNKFVCNAVVLARGRILTTADCLFLQKNKTYALGKPEEFHVALETHSIEQFQNGKAFAKSSKWKYLEKMHQKFSVKYDNKFGNNLFSDKLKAEEENYLMKALRSGGIDPKGRTNYVQVLNFSIHPGFRGPFSNDLAVLDIPDAYPADNSSVVEMSNVNVESAFNRVVQVHGFGVLSHGANETNRMAYFKVRTVEMYLIPPARCQSDLGDLFERDQHMCLKPKSNETLCFGFTGAPIVLDGKLIGIVEFGHQSCSLEAPVVGIRLDAFGDFLGLKPSGFLDRIRDAFRNLIERLMGVRL
ncbi:uncharacterized protein LOC135709680 [Ochlerotatus camptorhynchus]|uniref:uncharacterized protein LOC135709680 n=1 Tax=Ochlerotatus camptorhynchus TaxID=644619 RepID=UPI0031D5FDDB